MGELPTPNKIFGIGIWVNPLRDNLVRSIFAPFFTTERHAGDSSLGMHLVLNLVYQQLKGTIARASELGKGMCYRIAFPTNSLT